MSIDKLHRCLGHVSHARAKFLVDKGLILGIELDPDSRPTVCESCEWAKGQRKAIRKERATERAAAVGDEIHSDIWGPSPVESINRKRYYISFTDDHSRFTHVYFLSSKDQAFRAYVEVEAWYLTQLGIQLKCLHTDRGGEYLSAEFSNHLKLMGTIRKLTVHDTPEYNGVAERLNRTILAKVRAMLHDSKQPNFLWAEAARHAVYLKNRTWTRTLGETTPYELLHGKKPDLTGIHPWGCKVRVHDSGGNKLQGRSKIGVWVGYDEESNAHRIFWPEKRSITVERSVKFNVEDEAIVDAAPLEGEISADVDPDTAVNPNLANRSPISRRATVEDAPDDEDNASESPNPTDHAENIFRENEPIPEPAPFEPRRGSRVRKESEYVRRLRDGTGLSSARPSDPRIPAGIQENEDAGGVADAAGESDDWEMVEVTEQAMAAVMDGAEGLTPTFEEARKRSDWPKWKRRSTKSLRRLRQTTRTKSSNAHRKSTSSSAAGFCASKRIPQARLTSTKLASLRGIHASPRRRLL